MAGATIATVAAILKDLYLAPVTEQMNNEILLMQRLESSSQEVVGNRAVVPLHTTRTKGIGARGEDVALPEAGNQGYDVAYYDLKYLYGRGRVTGPSLSKTRNSAGSFLSVLEGEMDGIRTDLRLDTARQTYGDGSGQIAQCGTTANSTVVVLASAEPVRKGFLHIGMSVDIGTTADYDVVAGNRTIVDVDTANGTITISGTAVTTSSSHYVVRSGNAVSSSVIYEISGLRNLVATTDNVVGTIDSSAAGKSYWRNLRRNLAGALSLDSLTTAFNESEFAGGEVSLMVSTLGLQRQLFNLLQSQVRYNEPMTIRGGFRALDYNGRPFVADRHHPFGQIDFLDEKFLKFYTDGEDWHFMDRDGEVLKWVSGFDAWEFALMKYCNMGATRRNTQYLLYGITGDSTGV